VDGNPANANLPWRKIAALLPVFAVLAVWLPVQMGASLNTNHAWLLICAQRLLDGGRPLTDFYEPNPPLSILMYVPDILFSRLTHIPVYYTPYLFGLAAMSLSAWAVFSLLGRFSELDADARIVVMGAFLISSTIAASIMFFADRDEYVAWGLAPFLLAQLLITRGVALDKRLSPAVFIGGAICILVKPHFLLLPVTLVIHRMIRQRRFLAVFLDGDVLAIAGVSAIYGLVSAWLFRDYLNTILPDFVNLYIPVHRGLITAKKTVIGLFMLAFLRWGIKPESENIRGAVGCCTKAALLSGLLFVLQNKGNYYHEIPFLFFYLCGAALALHDFLRRRLRSSCLGAFTTFALIAIFTCMHAPVMFGFPTHADYKKLELTKLAEEAGPGKSFFVFSEGMEMIHQAALYSGHVHASRFPDMWFLTGMLEGWGNKGDDVRYANYVAEDLKRYKPAVLAIDVNMYVGGSGYFNFVGWMAVRSPAFREEMSHYIKYGPLVDNRRDYFKGATLDYDHFMTYDIYRRAP
jgi:hypothetical protein